MRYLLFLLALVLPAVAVAQEERLRGMKLDVIYAQAIEIGDYKTYCEQRRGGCPVPTIIIREMARHSKGPNILGEFEFLYPDRVSISREVEIGSARFTEIVFHEMIHYLDWIRGRIGPHSSCMQIVMGEFRAYDSTAKFMARYGVNRDYSAQRDFHRAECK